MKVTRLEAEKVHGYLPIHVDFLEDLTFLTGLNGSGKTSALRLLMALLTPNLEEFASISFSIVAATVSDQGREVVIRAERRPDGVEVSISDVPNILSLSSADLQLLTEPRRREEPRHLIDERSSSTRYFNRSLGCRRRCFSDSIGDFLQLLRCGKTQTKVADESS